jgi:hypothetical protein
MELVGHGEMGSSSWGKKAWKKGWVLGGENDGGTCGKEDGERGARLEVLKEQMMWKGDGKCE